MKTINKAIDGIKAVNGNSKSSEKAQTSYGLENIEAKKVDLSSGKLDKSGKPY